MTTLTHFAAGVGRYIRLFSRIGTSRLIMSAGMPRSGSTFLFNMLRVALEHEYGDNISSGWYADAPELAKGKVYIIKAHRLDAVLHARASQCFYTYRDARDAAVSYQRKFGREPSIEAFRHAMVQFQRARKYADLMLKYEQFTHAPEQTMADILRVLKIDADPAELTAKVPQASASGGKCDKSTLLHGGHATGTGQGEWRQVLKPELIEQIHSEFGWWFEENGYDLQ